MKKYLLILNFLFIISAITAQNNNKNDSLKKPKGDIIFSFSAYYAYEFPDKDLANRFGNNHKIGGQFTYKSATNWIFSFDGGYMFGTNLKKEAYTVLNPLKTAQGQITSKYGTPSDIALNERGFSFSITGGKILPFLQSNSNSGPLIMIGGGFLQHKIRIDVKGNDAPQLSEEYKKGYDKLTNGWGFRQFIGYRHYSENRMLNFFIGIETTQAYTQNRRGYNYDTMQADNTKRWDLLYSIKAGFIIPLAKRKPAEFYVF